MNNNINKELTNINNWLLAQRPSLNVLRLIIDRNMKWHTHPHVQKVATKIRNTNGLLHKFKYVFPHRIVIAFMIYASLDRITI